MRQASAPDLAAVMEMASICAVATCEEGLLCGASFITQLLPAQESLSRVFVACKSQAGKRGLPSLREHWHSRQQSQSLQGSRRKGGTGKPWVSKRGEAWRL